MTTDELKALLREVSLYLRESNWGHFIDHKLCTKCGLADKIDAAIVSDFCVVPKEPTEEMLEAFNAMAQCEGFIEEGYKAMISAAGKK